MPVNMVSHAHGQGYADLHFVIPETIEKVNIQKGTYNASIGDFATAGAISFTSKNVLDKNSIQLEKAMFNNNRVSAMANILTNNKSKKHNWWAAAEYNFNKGYWESPANLQRSNIFSKYIYQANAHNTITTQASYFTSSWNASGQIPFRAVVDKTITNFGSIDNTEGGQTSRTNISTTLKTIFKNNAILTNQVFYNQYNFLLFSNFTFYKNDSVNGDMIKQNEARRIIGYNSSYEKRNYFNGIQLQTKLGLQIRNDIINNSELSNVKQRYTFLKPIALGNVYQTNVALYVDQNINFSKKWSANIGIRHDVFRMEYNNKLQPQDAPVIKNITSPKLNIFYTLNSKMQFFAKAGKGFHSNDSRVVTAKRGVQILPAAFGSEVGGVLKPTKNLLLNIALWQLDLQ